jgi:hypothetical protein
MLLARNSGLTISILSVTCQLSAPLSVFALAQAYSFNVGLDACLALIPLVVLTTHLPITIGGWGLREGAIIAAMSQIDLPPSQSLVLSLTFGLSLVVLGLPGGVIWLFRSRIGRQHRKPSSG